MKTEAKVGFFVFLGLVAFFLLSTQVNSFGTFGKEGYTVTATMDTVLGLDKNAKVKMNGIDVGYVSDMALAGRDVKISMFIYKEAQIPVDSTVVMAQDSMLGSRFINLIPGVEEANLAQGGALTKEKHLSSLDETSTSINDAALELKAFIKEMRETLNPQARADLQQAIANFKVMAANLSTAGEKFGVMSESFNHTAGIVNTKLPPLMDKFSTLEDNLSVILSENRKPLNGAITSIDEFFKAGKPAVKNINKYLDRVTQSELQMGMSSNYMMKDRYAMTKVDINYLPNPTRYYMLGFTSRDNYSRLNSSGGVVLPQKHEDSQTYVSAQIGKRYNNTLVRGGIIENTGGLGVEQYALHDKLKGSLEVYDFGAKNDVRTTKPHARAEVRYQMLKHVNLYGGIDGFLDSKTTNAYVGAGVAFVDDDLKYLLGGSSSALLK